MTINTQITEVGQEWVDDPVLVWPVRNLLEEGVQVALDSQCRLGTRRTKLCVDLGKTATKADLFIPRQPITVRHERVKLRWMKPDGNGGLVPR